jgi:hypothetical protein
LPDWVDKYSDSNTGDTRFFVIEELMRRHDLTRQQAVEVQNHYRDLSRAGAAGGSESWLAEALRRVKAGEFESGFKTETFDKAPFIVVFDLDETLYDQRVKTAECATYKVPCEGKDDTLIGQVPGWEKAFGRIRELGGAIAIFSANLDDRTLANMNGWTWEGRPLTEHPDIAAILSNSHLTMQSKHEGPGREKASSGAPISQPSKDLRIFDESLGKVIIVDDNPTRLSQWGNVRWFFPFSGETYCTMDPDSGGRKAFDGAMDAVVDEIEDSVAWMKEHGGTFGDAFRPYSMAGREAVKWLMNPLGAGLDEAAAITTLRQQPELFGR